MIAMAVALLLLPAAARVSAAIPACSASVELAAAKKKPVTKVAKKKQPKVEYMRAVPAN
jgi:hypothetical protein